MIYVNHPVYDLHHAPNALGLKKTLMITVVIFISAFIRTLQFFIPVINTKR